MLKVNSELLLIKSPENKPSVSLGLPGELFYLINEAGFH